MLKKPASCEGCALHSLGMGWMGVEEWGPKAEVLLVGEALGEAEAHKAQPFIGAAGMAMFQTLAKEGLHREQFGIANTVWCRPPKNKLVGMPWEKGAVEHCAPHLDVAIKRRAPKVILALGATAANRLLLQPPGTHTLESLKGYWEWSEIYHAWVGATYHPSYIMRGNWKLTQVWLYDFLRALEISRRGYHHQWPEVLEDPPPGEWGQWVEGALARGGHLALDIETPRKGEVDEDTLEVYAPETIFRIGFALPGTTAVSVPWTAPYYRGIERLLTSGLVKLIWNAAFDQSRLREAGVVLGGEVRDVMYLWHTYQPDLPKKLGFVAPHLFPFLPRWKHMGHTRPAYYNGVDCVVLSDTERVLEKKMAGPLRAFHYRHVYGTVEALERMTTAGLKIDQERQREAITFLAGKLGELTGRMQAVVPDSLRGFEPKEGYKLRPPTEKEGLVQHPFKGKWKVCSVCGVRGPKKDHFKVYKKKPNTPCAGAEALTVEGEEVRWVRLVPFTPSNVQMKGYAEWAGHTTIAPRDKRREEDEEAATFDEMALQQLVRKYPDDPLYPLVLEYRKFEKLQGYVGRVNGEGRIVGGFPVHADGAIHPLFNTNPSTMRWASKEPNGNQFPRPEEEGSTLVRRCIVAREGRELGEVDFSGIEAVLVGYFARSERYVRLCRLGVHDFVNIHNLIHLGKWSEEPNLAWSDGDLKAMFGEAKKRFPIERNAAKKTVHSGNYGITPRGLYLREPSIYSSPKDAERLLSLYLKDLFPEIPQWQWETLREAKKEKRLTTVWGNHHWFHRPLKWVKDARTGKWEEVWGEDAERALAFRPQSTAAGILKEAILTLWAERPEVADFLRLPNHDALLTEHPKWMREYVMGALVEVMQRPIPQLPLPWGDGVLQILTEGKVGDDWAAMEKWG